jgi:hypothetical protein
MRIYLTLIALTILSLFASAQDYVYTKEGRILFSRQRMIYQCLNYLKATKEDKTALSICECRVDKLNKRFTNKQLKKYTDDGIINLDGMINEDSVVKKDLQACFTNTGLTVLLSAERFGDKFISSCVETVKSRSSKTLDSNRVKSFCYCQLELVKTKKISDAEMNTLENPNSVLFYEMMYKCGSPFAKDELDIGWKPAFVNDIRGPEVDTIGILTLNGLTYLKVGLY